MATIKYLYRSTKNTAELTLRLLFRYMGEDFTIDSKSGITVEQEFWKKHFNQKKLKDIALINEQTRVSKATNDLTVFLLDRLGHNKSNPVNKIWLQTEIDNYYNPKVDLPNVPTALINYFDYYIELLITNRNTRKKLITTKNKLIKYQEDVLKKVIEIEEIDNLFLNDLKKYLVKLSYNQNTILGDFTNIKTICRHAKSVIPVKEQIFSWSLKKEKTPFVYLTVEEIDAIIALSDLPEYLSNARDWLIISCYTGQRVSDFMLFDKSKIRAEKEHNGTEIKLIEFTQKKTKQHIALPLHQEVIKILEKRNGDFPRPLSDVKYNKYIKEVAFKAGLVDELEAYKLNPEINRKEKKLYPKYELITSHIGRRSFATNHYGKIPTVFLMSATGHMSEKMFLNYIGKTQADLARSLSKYFKYDV
jgi:integrase